ncbi:uncharacterized protein LOC133824416 [Humulus lupulus]|uniref:uncharacterized protein LOC133824416 n=1 Tax=Humulus lupulus TaxID=3486 RepID=UPI002B401982|nr:uncharacterized protein LOC133824416 [Humulus lupulus]
MEDESRPIDKFPSISVVSGYSSASDESQVRVQTLGSQVNNPSSTSRTVIDDLADPYYLHHADNPDNVLVSQLLTGQDNYTSWIRAMKLSISVKNKLGFLDGSITKPSQSDSFMSNAWIRNNNIVISWILNFVSKEISASIIYDESAAKIWNDLKARFQQKNGPHIFNLGRDLMNLRQELQSVSQYYTHLKTLWEELSNYRPFCTCNMCTYGGVKALQEHHNMEYIMSFLMGLKYSYSQVRGNILLMDPLPSLSRVFNLVTQEENQRGDEMATPHIETSSNPSMVFAFSGANSSTSKTNSRSTKSFPPRKNRLLCTHCNVHGHTIEKCYEIHGYPPGYNKPRQQSSPPAISTNPQLQ